MEEEDELVVYAECRNILMWVTSYRKGEGTERSHADRQLQVTGYMPDMSYLVINVGYWLVE